MVNSSLLSLLFHPLPLPPFLYRPLYTTLSPPVLNLFLKAALLHVEAREAEEFAARMIKEERLLATIDQVRE
jgi:hypothetical protein